MFQRVKQVSGCYLPEQDSIRSTSFVATQSGWLRLAVDAVDVPLKAESAVTEHSALCRATRERNPGGREASDCLLIAPLATPEPPQHLFDDAPGC